MRLFVVKPGINALGQPLPIEFTVDNLFDMLVLAGMAVILVSGVLVTAFIVWLCATSAPPAARATPATYRQQGAPSTYQLQRAQLMYHQQEAPIQSTQRYDHLYERRRIYHYIHQ